jgi:hypothetical protein
MNEEGHVAGVATGPAEGVAGGLAGGGEGRAPASAAGPSPAAGEAVRHWRRTRKGAVTQSIAVCETCQAVVEPTRIRRSRSGTHGEDYYAHTHRLVFLELLQSNSGNRSYSIEGEVSEKARTVFEEAARLWVYHALDAEDVKEYVKYRLR